MGKMSFDDGAVQHEAAFKTPFGIIAGAGGGIKLGAGALYLDLRYLMDMDNVSARYNGAGSILETAIGKRQKFSLSLGYEFGFISN
jgi:hypothetical protein